MNECLYCGSYYLRSESVAKSTTEAGSYSFCSREHEDKFKEEQDVKIVEWKKENPDYDPAIPTKPQFDANLSIGDLLKNMHSNKGTK